MIILDQFTLTHTFFKQLRRERNLKVREAKISRPKVLAYRLERCCL